MRCFRSRSSVRIAWRMVKFVLRSPRISLISSWDQKKNIYRWKNTPDPRVLTSMVYNRSWILLLWPNTTSCRSSAQIRFSKTIFSSRALIRASDTPDDNATPNVTPNVSSRSPSGIFVSSTFPLDFRENVSSTILPSLTPLDVVEAVFGTKKVSLEFPRSPGLIIFTAGFFDGGTVPSPWPNSLPPSAGEWPRVIIAGEWPRVIIAGEWPRVSSGGLRRMVVGFRAGRSAGTANTLPPPFGDKVPLPAGWALGRSVKSEAVFDAVWTAGRTVLLVFGAEMLRLSFEAAAKLFTEDGSEPTDATKKQSCLENILWNFKVKFWKKSPKTEKNFFFLKKIKINFGENRKWHVGQEKKTWDENHKKTWQRKEK